MNMMTTDENDFLELSFLSKQHILLFFDTVKIYWFNFVNSTLRDAVIDRR